MFEMAQCIPAPAMSCFTHKPEDVKLQLNFVVKGVEGNREGEIEAEIICRHGNPMEMFFPLKFQLCEKLFTKLKRISSTAVMDPEVSPLTKEPVTTKIT